MKYFYSIKRRCKQNKCITRKIRKYKPTTIHYAYPKRSILIKTDSDVDKYFDCYKIHDIVKKLCKKWILLGGGCYLDYSISYCGTIYLSKTKKSSFYNHIHVFPYSENSFNWHDKKSKQYGEERFSKSVDKCIEKFIKLLSN
jgi:hypothetical protein